MEQLSQIKLYDYRRSTLMYRYWTYSYSTIYSHRTKLCRRLFLQDDARSTKKQYCYYSVPRTHPPQQPFKSRLKINTYIRFELNFPC